MKRECRFARVAFLAVLIIVCHRLQADEPMDAWNLHGPQQFSEGRPATWLDPLRRSGARTSERDLDLDSDSDSVDQFDLSEFSSEPESTGSFRLDSEDRVLSEFTDTTDTEYLKGTEATGVSHGYLSPEGVFRDQAEQCSDVLVWQVMPQGLLYSSYLAAEKEPRMQLLQSRDTRSKRTVWDAILGGRVGLLRYGPVCADSSPAFQLDLEGAVFARVLPDEPSAMLEGSDYRVGLYGTWKQDRFAYKLGYYHISSHVGDEYLLAHPAFQRINYVRDSTLFGVSWDWTEATRIYSEMGYAPGTQGGAKPLEFQFGAEYTPVAVAVLRGAPFLAANAHLRQDFDFEGGYSLATGWGWQGPETHRRLRVGLNYYHGPSLQYEFFDRWENLVGGGIWLDY